MPTDSVLLVGGPGHCLKCLASPSLIAPPHCIARRSYHNPNIFDTQTLSTHIHSTCKKKVILLSWKDRTKISTTLWLNLLTKHWSLENSQQQGKDNLYIIKTAGIFYIFILLGDSSPSYPRFPSQLWVDNSFSPHSPQALSIILSLLLSSFVLYVCVCMYLFV